MALSADERAAVLAMRDRLQADLTAAWKSLRPDILRVTAALQPYISDLTAAWKSLQPYVQQVHDWQTLKDAQAPRQMRYEAAYRLFPKFHRFSLRHPRVYPILRTLRRENRTPIKAWLRAEFPVALDRAIDQIDEPQRIRIGAVWKKDARGRVARHLMPRDLEPEDLLSWIVARVFGYITDAVFHEIDGDGAQGHMQRQMATTPARLPSELSRLTPRQLEILRLRVGGCDTAEIADRLGLTPSAVRAHLSNARQRSS